MTPQNIQNITTMLKASLRVRERVMRKERVTERMIRREEREGNLESDQERGEGK